MEKFQSHYLSLKRLHTYAVNLHGNLHYHLTRCRSQEEVARCQNIEHTNNQFDQLTHRYTTLTSLHVLNYRYSLKKIIKRKKMASLQKVYIQKQDRYSHIACRAKIEQGVFPLQSDIVNTEIRKRQLK